MNTANLKCYAPQARRDFLAAVTTRAQRLGISANSIAPVTVQGDLMLIGGTAYPRSLDAKRNQLIAKIKKHGFDQVMEEAAYTWFNRFMAIRYMEVHGYFAHGFRVLSNPSGGNQPEILQQAQSVDIPGLDKKRVVELLSQGNQQEELYRTLILAQSKALGQAMPFLFDTIDTSTELLLPDGLLAPQSVVRKLVGDIPEDDWQSTEILGWLYQFYVSDEKARVDALVKQGKAVQPDDIPAKTQLFTPNWIVQFMTQNSLGRLWMDVYPDSPLKDKMPYYTAPAEQEPDVAAKLRELTPSSLDPNTLTAIDPAAGSGHILLVLYELFYEFYRERGYPPSEIPRLILSQNLYGLELDRRAAQIAGFAVLMRARRDDPTLLSNPPVVNVLSIVSSYGLYADAIADTLLAPIRSVAAMAPEDGLFPELAIQPRLAEAAEGVKSEATKADVKALVELFAEADVYGSLIRVPDSLAKQLPALRGLVTANLGVADLDRQASARELSQLVRQAEFLAAYYTVCVANPPYLGIRNLSDELRTYLLDEYPDCKTDLYSAFIARGLGFAVNAGKVAMITMRSWMLQSSFEGLRHLVCKANAIDAVLDLPLGVFTGFSTAITIIAKCHHQRYLGKFRVLDRTHFSGSAVIPAAIEASPVFERASSFFDSFPKLALLYDADEQVLAAFQESHTVETQFAVRQGLATGMDARFLRYWHEVPWTSISLTSTSPGDVPAQGKKWVPFQKGGAFRRWYGNNEYVIDFSAEGFAALRQSGNKCPSKAFYFRQGITWTVLTVARPSFRYMPASHVIGHKGSGIFADSREESLRLLGYLNSRFNERVLSIISDTMMFEIGTVKSLPCPELSDVPVEAVEALIVDAKTEWDQNEESWDFLRDPYVAAEARSLRTAQESLDRDGAARRSRVLDNEARIETALSNRSAADSNDSEAVDQVELVFERCVELVSYAVGVMLGRYSLDETGLIYAHQGGVGFDPSRYQTFPADQDGILPVTEDDFFGEEDTSNRIAKWVKTVWPNSPLDENLDFIADALGRKANETALEAIRRYLATDFYKDHLQTYKKRPIYWLFSSGKHRAFQALVYLHRYNESTLSTMRSDYVTPLFGKLSARIAAAEQAEQVGSTAERKAATKRLAKLRAQQVELIEFDTRLHHYALQRISLDLDDGVKVNYGKFSDPAIGDILANVKDITGGKGE